MTNKEALTIAVADPTFPDEFDHVIVWPEADGEDATEFVVDVFDADGNEVWSARVDELGGLVVEGT